MKGMSKNKRPNELEKKGRIPIANGSTAHSQDRYLQLPEIKLGKIIHQRRSRITLEFKYDFAIKEHLKKLEGYRWSASKRVWHFPDTDEMLEKIKNHFKGIAVINDEGMRRTVNMKGVIKERNLSVKKLLFLKEYGKYLRGKRLSESTVSTYTTFLADFLDFLGEKTLEDMTNRDIELFGEDILSAFNYSVSTHRQFISAIKQLKKFRPDLPIEDLKLHRPKKSLILPAVLSKEEVMALLINTKNLKHRAALTLIYSSGLRVGELLNLKLDDMDLVRKQIMIRNAKGRKDRVVIFAENFIPLYNNYIMTYRPVKYFIEGSPGKKYSAESIRAVIKRSSLAAGIRKRVTPHTLRHSFATHLLEDGVDLRYIQELLGHTSPKTTMIYTHVSKKDILKIVSPLDKFQQILPEGDKNNNKLLL